MPKSVFEYRPPTEDDKVHLEALQQAWLQAETAIMDHVPPGRGRSLAITKLQECRMWANAGIVGADSGGQSAG